MTNSKVVEFDTLTADVNILIDEVGPIYQIIEKKSVQKTGVISIRP